MAVGAAQGALDDIIALARSKVALGDKSTLAADPVAQHLVGTLATDLYMARALLHQIARDEQASVDAGPPSQADMVARRARLARVGSVSAGVVDGCYAISGTSGLYESSALQRRLRDVKAITQHYLLSLRGAFAPAGAALLSDTST